MPNRKRFNREYTPTAAGTVTDTVNVTSYGYQPVSFGWEWVPTNGTDKISFSVIRTGPSGYTFSAEVEGAGTLTAYVTGLDDVTYQGNQSI